MKYILVKKFEGFMNQNVYYLWVRRGFGKWLPFQQFDRIKRLDNERGPLYQVRFYDLVDAYDYVDILKQNIGWSERKLKVIPSALWKHGFVY